MKLKLNIPDTLNDITLAQYIEFDRLNVEGNKDTVFLMQKTVEIFCRVDLKLTLQIKYNDLIEITERIYSLLDGNPELTPIFKIDNIEYGFIPNLDEMSLGEYVDLDTYISSWDNMHKAMAVLYRPIDASFGSKYTIEEYDGVGQEKMKDMPLDVVFGSMIFFYRLGIDLSQVMMSYFQDKKQIPSRQLEVLMENMGGLDKFTTSVNTMLQELKISLN